MKTLTGFQVAELAGMPYESFRKMGAARKPTRQADGTYLRSDVNVWLEKRRKRSVALAPVPKEEAPIIVLPKTHDAKRGRVIDGEDEHVLHERLSGRGVNVKVLNKVLSDLSTDINVTSRTLVALKKNVAELERLLAIKKATYLTYQETRDALVREAGRISEDLDDQLMDTVAEVEAELARERKG